MQAMFFTTMQSEFCSHRRLVNKNNVLCFSYSAHTFFYSIWYFTHTEYKNEKEYQKQDVQICRWKPRKVVNKFNNIFL